VKIDHALTELHAAENDLAAELLAIASRHDGDFEVAHVARDLAVWSQDHVRLVAEAGRRYGVELDPEPAGDPGLPERVRQGVADRLRSSGAGRLQLLRDLRRVYVDASGVSVDWELIAQAAQGVRDRELLALTSRCHPDTLRQARWANAQLKESATQILVS
jgi:hypothetical protein